MRSALARTIPKARPASATSRRWGGDPGNAPDAAQVLGQAPPQRVGDRRPFPPGHTQMTQDHAGGSVPQPVTLGRCDPVQSLDESIEAIGQGPVEIEDDQPIVAPCGRLG